MHQPPSPCLCCLQYSSGRFSPDSVAELALHLARLLDVIYDDLLLPYAPLDPGLQHLIDSIQLESISLRFSELAHEALLDELSSDPRSYRRLP